MPDLQRLFPILPMRTTVILPGQPQPVLVGRPSSKEMLRRGETFVALSQRGDSDVQSVEDFHSVGVICPPCGYSTLDASDYGGEAGEIVFMAPVGGTQRARLVELRQLEPYAVARFTVLPERPLTADDPVAMELRSVAREFVSRNTPPHLRDAILAHIASMPVTSLACFLATMMDLPRDVLHRLLEAEPAEQATIAIELLSSC